MPIKTQTYSSLADKASRRLIHSVNEWCMGKYSQNYDSLLKYLIEHTIF